MPEKLNDIEIENLLRTFSCTDYREEIKYFFGNPNYFTIIYMKLLKKIIKKYNTFKEYAGYGSFDDLIEKIQYDIICTIFFLIKNLEGINYCHYYVSLHSITRNKKYFNDMKSRKDVAYFHNGIYLMDKARKCKFYKYFSLNEVIDSIEISEESDKLIIELNSIFTTYYISYFYFNKIIEEYKEKSLLYNDSLEKIKELKRMYKNKMFSIKL